MYNFNEELMNTNWTLPIATAIGALGMGMMIKDETGLPNSKLSNNILFQIVTMIILIWQGGSGQNIQIASITGIGFVLLIHMYNYMVLDIEDKDINKFFTYLSVGGDTTEYIKKID